MSDEYYKGDDEQAPIEESLKKSQQRLIQQRVDDARNIVEELVSMRDFVKALPRSRSDSQKIVAAKELNSAEQSLEILAPRSLDLEQAQAAILLGGGLTAKEVAEYLGIGGGAASVHQWRMIPEFKKLLRYWREIAEDDQRAAILKEMELLSTMNLSVKGRLGLLALRMKLAYKPEERAMAEADLALRMREVELKEREVSQHGKQSSRPTWLSDPIASEPTIDVEFSSQEGET